MLESGDAARRNDAAFIEDGFKGESGLAAMFGYEGGPGLSSYFFVLPQTEIEVVSRLKVWKASDSRVSMRAMRELLSSKVPRP